MENYIKTLLLTIIGCLAMLSATAQKTAQKIEGAHIQMQTVSHDFGDVARKGGDVSYDFVFTNDGTEPLVLTHAITSCSCIKTTFSKKPVPPQAQGVIRVTFQTRKSEPGTFNRVIQIYSNAADGRMLITVQGNSIDN